MRSMTGFGRAQIAQKTLRIEAEVRSLNQRFFEVKMNLPRGWSSHEAEMRKLVQSVVARGRVEVLIRRIATRPAVTRLVVNHDLALQYVRELRRLGREFDLNGKMGVEAILQRPEIFQVVEENQDEQFEVKAAFRALKKALEVLQADREREGRSLQRDLAVRLKRIAVARREMVRLATQSRSELMANFSRRIKEILADLPLDERRLYEEASSIAQRADISEELARLEAHLNGMREIFRRSNTVGKSIEFLLQELNREINTIGSKSQNIALSRLAIEARAELEKMREQVQNVE